jgi:hypothetical protein
VREKFAGFLPAEGRVDLGDVVDQLAAVQRTQVGASTALEQAWVSLWDRYWARQPFVQEDVDRFLAEPARSALLADPKSRSRVPRSIAQIQRANGSPRLRQQLQQFLDDTRTSYAARAGFDADRENRIPRAMAEAVEQRIDAANNRRTPFTLQDLKAFFADPVIDEALRAEPGLHEVVFEGFIGTLRGQPDPTGRVTTHTHADLLGEVRLRQVEDARVAQRRLDALLDPRRPMAQILVPEIERLLRGESALALRANPALWRQLDRVVNRLNDIDHLREVEAINIFQEQNAGSYAARTPIDA